MYGNRYQKKRMPTGVLVVTLILVIVLSYYISGLFIIADLSLENAEERLAYIFMHPLMNWWNDKSLGCMAIGFIIWFLVVGYFQYYYRDFHMDIENGSADWLDARMATKELEDEKPQYNRILSQNVRVSLRDGLSNNNMLIIGSSGSFKTTSLMHQNLLNSVYSNVVLDVKGDTQRKLGKKLQQQGATIWSLNLKEPEKSDRINPFVYIEKEHDMLRIVKCLQDSVRKPDHISAADPFWDDGVRLYLQALFYYVWLDAREKGKTGDMNDLLRLVRYENQKMPDGETSKLEYLMNQKADKYGEDYPPVRDYRKLKEGAEDTVRSIVIMVNAMLSICETAEVKRIFSGNDINIRELGTGIGGDPSKRVVLFLVIPDNNPVYNFLISMFYTQMFDILIRLSDDELKRPLPVPVEFWMDEFYAGAKPSDPDVLLGVVRSRNISMIPILQSISQLKTLFKDNKWETIMDNVATVVFLGSGPMASSTHKYISEALSKATMDSRGDNVHHGFNGNSGLDFKRTGRELMTEDEVKRMPPTDCIIFLESRPPIYDTKIIPFDKKRLHYKAPKAVKKRYSEALSHGDYEHPVYTIYDAEHFHYITVKRKQKIQFLTGEEAQTYRSAAKTDPHILEYNIDEKDLLYLNWGTTKREPGEVEKMLKEALKEEKRTLEKVKELIVLQDVEDETLERYMSLDNADKSQWQVKGSLKECLEEYWDQLSAPEQEEICLAMDDGLTDQQICNLIFVSLDKMEQYRRAYRIMNAS